MDQIIELDKYPKPINWAEYHGNSMMFPRRSLDLRCWEDSQVCSCAFCGGLIVEVSQCLGDTQGFHPVLCGEFQSFLHGTHSDSETYDSETKVLGFRN